MSRRAVGVSALVVVACLALAAAWLRGGSAYGAEPRWEAPRLAGDSITVGVHWTPVCDILGCPDAYRVVWLATRDGRTEPVRDTVVQVTWHAVPVLRPAPIDTVRVCVFVSALRRGRSATPTSACRDFTTADADPPPVDSIGWDSLGVETHRAVLDSVVGPMEVYAAGYQVRDTLDPVTGVVGRDTRRVVRRMEHKDTLRANAKRMGLVPDEEALAEVVGDSVRVWEVMLGYRVANCAALRHRDGAYIVPVWRVPHASREMMALWVDMCRVGILDEVKPAPRLRFVLVEAEEYPMAITPWDREPL